MSGCTHFAAQNVNSFSSARAAFLSGLMPPKLNTTSAEQLIPSHIPEEPHNHLFTFTNEWRLTYSFQSSSKNLKEFKAQLTSVHIGAFLSALFTHLSEGTCKQCTALCTLAHGLAWIFEGLSGAQEVFGIWVHLDESMAVGQLQKQRSLSIWARNSFHTQNALRNTHCQAMEIQTLLFALFEENRNTYILRFSHRSYTLITRLTSRSIIHRDSRHLR